MPEPIPTTEDKFSETDLAKVGIDYVKHISTLSSGSIVVLATFFEKLADLRFKALVGISMAFLASSILLSCVSMLWLMLHGARPEKRTIKLARRQTLFVSLSVMSFITGIYFLAMFVMLNVAFGK